MHVLESLTASWDKPTVASIVSFALLLAAYCILEASGLVVHDSAWTTPFVVAVFVLLIAALAARPRLSSRFENGFARAKPFVLGGLVLLAFYLFEKPYNAGLFDIGAYYAFVNLCVIAALFAIVYFAGQQTKTAAIAFLCLCFIAGVANYFVIAFKGQPVLPADLFALSTAAAVGGGYTYAVNDSIAMAFCALACGIALVLYLPKTKFAVKRSVANTAVAALCVASFGLWFSHFDIEKAYGIQVDGWAASDSYSQQGSVLCFLKRMQDLSPAEPAGYSPEAAAGMLAPYADEADDTGFAERSDSEKPIVIAVMNETFSDLSTYPNLADIYDGPAFYNSLQDAYLKGTAYVSALGAGTCNSEFEFLTGTTMANLGEGVYPYMLYDLDGTENLATYFKELGYETTAIHPADATNWRRDTVYRQLGFDTFLDVTDFEGAETLRGFTTDRETYDAILQIIADSDTPQFIFDVTLQNHGGYDTGLIPDGMEVSIPLESDRTAELEEFASCIEQSDLDLRYLIESLSAIDRPIVLCLFGDHQPGFSDWLSSLAFGKDVADFSIEEVQARYEVPYLIWTNFETERATVLDGSFVAETRESELEALAMPLYPDATVMSLNYLGAHMLAAAELPLSPYYRLLLDTQKDLPVVNVNGYLDAEGSWHWQSERYGEGEADRASEALARLAIVQHELLFGS